MRNILFLTATIAPRAGTFLLARTAVEERLEDYRQSLFRHIALLKDGTFDHAVFADNSGWPLDDLAAMAAQAGVADRITFVSFVCTLDQNISRFYLELNLIRTALARAELAFIQPNDRIWKLTGRYKIMNLRSIVRSAPPKPDLYVNTRLYPKPWTDFYIAAFTPQAFQDVFVNNIEAYRCFIGGEEILCAHLNGASPPGVSVVQRLRRTPRLAGVRGFDGRRYDDARGRLGYAARVAARRLLPSLWI